MLKSFALALTVLAEFSQAHAASHQVNIAPVREFIEGHLLNKGANRLKLTNKLDAKDMGKGVTASAAHRANGSLGAFVGYGKGGGVRAGDGVFVAKMGKEKLLVTAVGNRFVARTGKNGLVIARGNITKGQINWTSSHNRQAPGKPAERNAAP